MWIYLAAALAALAIGFGSGWTTRTWKADHDDAERLASEARTALLRAERVDTAAAADQSRQAAMRVQTRIVYREVEKLVAADPGLAAVCLGVDSLQLVARAARATGGASELAGAVRAASAAE